MYSYPEVHSTVPGWLLALLSLGMGAAGALAELVPARGRRLSLRARTLLAVAAAVDAAEAVAYAIAMTMWLKRYTGVPRPNFAALCKGAPAANGRIECTTKRGACPRSFASTHDVLLTRCCHAAGSENSRQAYPSGHAAITGALGVYVSARLVQRFAAPRPWPPQRGARLAALLSAIESALVMVRHSLLALHRPADADVSRAACVRGAAGAGAVGERQPHPRLRAQRGRRRGRPRPRRVLRSSHAAAHRRTRPPAAPGGRSAAHVNRSAPRSLASPSISSRCA